MRVHIVRVSIGSWRTGGRIFGSRRGFEPAGPGLFEQGPIGAERPHALRRDQAFQLIEHLVWHQVIFIGLIRTGRSEFCGGRQCIDSGKGRDGWNAFQTVGFHDAKPLTQKRLLNSGDWRQSTARITIHGGIAYGHFGSIAGCQEETAFEIGHHPDTRSSNPRLDVLTWNIVALPIKRSSNCFGDDGFVLLNQGFHIEFEMACTDGLGK